MASSTIRILLLEDNPDDVRLIRTYLGQEQENGLCVEIDDVGRLVEGLKRLEQSAVDVALVDLNLPDSCGLDTVREVMAHHPNLPVVVLTGAEVMDTALQAVREGATDFLFKTRLDGPLLVRAIRFAVERSQQRETRARLQETEACYRTLFEQSPDGIVLLHPDSLRPFDFNEAANRQLGYTRSEFGQLCLFDYEASSDPQQTARQLEEALHKGRSRFETQFRAKSGYLRDFLVLAQPVSLTNRTLLYCIYRDISARKRSDDRLRESEERFRSLVETTSDWIWEIDRQGVFTYCSPRVEDLLGFQPEEVLGRQLFELVAPDDRDRFRESVTKSMRSASPVVCVEHTNLHRDGRLVVLETSAIPVLGNDGSVQRYRGIDRDITLIKESQDSLRERERRYRQLLDAVTNYTYSVRVDEGHSLWTSHGDGCLAVTGYGPEDYRTNPTLWISMVHPDDREALLAIVDRVLAGEEVAPMEHRILHRDGTTRWVRSTLVLHKENGVMVRYDGLVEDITQRKLAERALRQRELQLLAAQKIQERLLPRTSPNLPGYDLAGALFPAEFAAGDYYDFLPMHDKNLGIVIGDVSGHGFASALIMASVHVLLRLLVEPHADVGQILSMANSVVVKDTEEGRFVTLLLVQLDPKSGTLTYASAGHPPGLLLDAQGNLKAKLNSTGLPLGIVSNAEYDVQGPIPLETGDTVVMVTDGITESQSPAGELFMAGGMLSVIREHLHCPAKQFARQLCLAAREFTQRGATADDTTAVVIRVSE
jgi:PAS domain S-box-containing protein